MTQTKSLSQEEIISMAVQAGAKKMVSCLTTPKGPVTAIKFDLDNGSLEAFAKLVASAASAKEREAFFDVAMKAAESAVDTAITLEREACAQICENFADVDTYPDGIIQDYHAHLIRLRGEA